MICWILGCLADSDAEGQAFQCVQLPAVEESVAVGRGLLQRADRRGVELLTVRAPDEISPLFTFETVGRHVSSWPLRALVEARALGVAVAQLKEAIWGCRRLLREWECHLCVIGASFCHSFRPLQVRSLDCFLCKES